MMSFEEEEEGDALVANGPSYVENRVVVAKKVFFLPENLD